MSKVSGKLSSKSFSMNTLVIARLLNIYWKSVALASFLLMCITLHFSWLKLRPFSDDQSLGCCKSFCSAVQSASSFTTLQIFMSSAKRRMGEDILSGRSLTNRRKRSGPRIAPWDTPDVEGLHSDLILTLVQNCLPSRYSLNQESRGSLIPADMIL
ncbi:unnamed protein product [Heterobilharzia americana]|nr:unnamed protein product [Heterobilharzia americana]